ncbi:MAG TPA: hypothetical protein VGO96_08880 [Pyrinomonadaceae bacterium]|jgi:hypothetical protein|nr:hypothetical protein [Pyrinomonadaceae bacterium]
MWNDETNALKNRITNLSNAELLQMVNLDYEQYRKEAIDYARAEMDRRGLKIEPVSFANATRIKAGDAEYSESDAEVSDDEQLESSEEFPPETDHVSGVEFKVFRGVWTSWDELFAEAAAFAAEIGSVRLISISHSSSGSEGIVTVWYWG